MLETQQQNKTDYKKLKLQEEEEEDDDDDEAEGDNVINSHSRYSDNNKKDGNHSINITRASKSSQQVLLQPLLTIDPVSRVRGLGFRVMG